MRSHVSIGGWGRRGIGVAVLLFALAFVAACNDVNPDPGGGTIRGYMTDAATDDPLSGGSVVVTTEDGVTVATPSTNTFGEFRADVPAGTYKVAFAHTGYVSEYFDEQSSAADATPVVVTAGMITRVDEDLVASTSTESGAIEGTVTDAVTGQPIHGPNTVGIFTSSDQFVVSASTDENGHYAMALPGGGSFKLAFTVEGGGYQIEYFHDKSTLAAADNVIVVEGATTIANESLTPTST